jgi:glycosyltransferase involved in cell wall biosynthesis
LCFLGRICPIKGTHHAIEIAKRAGMPLKIAGEVQPIFRKYYEREIRPHVDGRNVEFVGEADLALKNELLSNATAMLFPIGWDEPFGLAMIEAMACGTPVIAFDHGSVPEVIDDGLTGFVVGSIADAVAALYHVDTLDRRRVRDQFEQRFTVERMAQDYLAAYRHLPRMHRIEPRLELVSA